MHPGVGLAFAAAALPALAGADITETGGLGFVLAAEVDVWAERAAAEWESFSVEETLALARAISEAEDGDPTRLAEIAPAAGGVDPAAAAAAVARLGHDAVAVLADPALGEIERAARFADLFRRDFDIPLIARFALGRYWKSATAPEREA